jgi:hypothetical protein
MTPKDPLISTDMYVAVCSVNFCLKLEQISRRRKKGRVNKRKREKEEKMEEENKEMYGI